MDWKSLNTDDRDRLAWEAMCRWPEAAGWNPVSGGIDHARLSRCLLWGTVGGAVRRIVSQGRQAPLPVPGAAAATRDASPAARGVSLRGRLLDVRRRLTGRATLFCPFPYTRHARILPEILARGRGFDLTVPADHAARWPGTVPVAMPKPVTPEDGEPGLCNAKVRAMVEGLRRLGIPLLPEEASLLEGAIWAQQARVREAAAALAAIRPGAVLLPADNHPPFVEYAEVARREGIPAIMLQHGLDCERYVLDEAHASHIALWGPERRRRYERASSFQPALTVVGNPAYDAPPAEVGPADPLAWVWVTRPHRPEKCVLPSRSPEEGLAICDGLCGALERVPGARLVIKPHPFDDAEAYGVRALERGLGERIRVVQQPVDRLLANAGVVVSEDSTAGMDAMRLGRVLVHAHFAPSPPVMPFVEEGAALPGFSEGQLVASLEQAVALAGVPPSAMRQGQERFLDDFAGPRDGRATERFVEFVNEIVLSSGSRVLS